MSYSCHGTLRGRAPHVGDNPWAYLLRRLGPGAPSAPRGSCLPLLPSGPGGVHKSLSRRTQPSMTPFGDIGLKAKPQGGIRPRYSGLRVQGTASSPPSTASKTMVGRGESGCQSSRSNQLFRSLLDMDGRMTPEGIFAIPPLPVGEGWGEGFSQL